VRNDQRHCVPLSRPDVDEVDIEAVDLCLELRKGVEFRLALSPVVFRSPVANEFPKLRQLRALRLIWNRFIVGPPRGLQSSAEIGHGVVGQLRSKQADRRVVLRSDNEWFGECLGCSRGSRRHRRLNDRRVGLRGHFRLAHSRPPRPKRGARCVLLRTARTCRPSGPALLSRKWAERRAVRVRRDFGSFAKTANSNSHWAPL
jgi:hypothetical protein